MNYIHKIFVQFCVAVNHETMLFYATLPETFFTKDQLHYGLSVEDRVLKLDDYVEGIAVMSLGMAHVFKTGNLNLEVDLSGQTKLITTQLESLVGDKSCRTFKAEVAADDDAFEITNSIMRLIELEP